LSGDADTKREMRAGARRARAALSADVRAEASDVVAGAALDLPEVAAARSVLAYAALPEEIDPAPLVRALRGRGARVAYPRVCGPGVLALHWTAADDELAPGHAGIPEPASDSPWASPDDFDLVIVPGVAFDAACGRLGLGGGFYDAFLPTLATDTVTVALAFDEQMVDSVPCEEHDSRVHYVVTPSETHRHVR
jgi:5-formyltetrahydrofolate cyclo-ligase